MPPDPRENQGSLLALFPAIAPYMAGTLELDAPHRMYYEQSGNPKGVPVVFLHGGPAPEQAPCTASSSTRRPTAS